MANNVTDNHEVIMSTFITVAAFFLTMIPVAIAVLCAYCLFEAFRRFPYRTIFFCLATAIAYAAVVKPWLDVNLPAFL